MANLFQDNHIGGRRIGLWLNSDGSVHPMFQFFSLLCESGGSRSGPLFALPARTAFGFKALFRTTTREDRSRPLKHIHRARIVLLSAERLSVQDVARRAGVEGLLRDKTRPPGTPPHSTETVAEVLALTCSEPPGEVTHWTGRAAHAVVLSIDEKSHVWMAPGSQAKS